jgi:hypothetical protein
LSKNHWEGKRQTMTIDDYIQQRNGIQLKAEAQGEEIAKNCWTELGAANRHIEHVITGKLKLSDVEHEIIACLRRVEGWLDNNPGKR